MSCYFKQWYARRCRDKTYDSDNTDALVAPLICDLLPRLIFWIESCTVVQPTLEVLKTRNVWHIPSAERAIRGEQQVCSILYLLGLSGGAGLRAADADVPLSSGFIVARVHDLVAKLNITHELVLVDDAFEVFADLRSRRVECRPVMLMDRSNGGQTRSKRIRTFSSKDS